MCYLITIDISREPAALMECLREQRLHVTENANAHVRDAFGAERVIVDVTRGWCSCSLYQEQVPSVDEEAERRKYVRRGWSSAKKIERAIDQKKAAGSHRGPSEFDQFLKVLKQCIENTGELAILAHMYSGSFFEESVQVKDRRRMTLAEFEAAGGAYPPDTVITVSRV